MGTTVIEVLRRFLPKFLRGMPALDKAKRRAIWAITHCRTAVNPAGWWRLSAMPQTAVSSNAVTRRLR